MPANRTDGLGAERGNHKIAVRGIVGIGADFLTQPRLQGRLRFRIQLLVRPLVFVLRPMLKHPDRFAMQPIRRPVRGDISAVTPDAANLLTTERLPDILAFADLLGREQEVTLLSDNALRNGRRLPINVGTEVTENGE